MNNDTDRRENLEAPAFTIVELLVTVSILVIILLMVFSVVGQASNVWRGAIDKIEAFQGARAAFEIVTRNLSQATLNTYLDYDNPTAPSQYLRKSELRFLSAPAGGDLPGATGTGQAIFFQAPASFTAQPATYGGLEMLLNTCGYYIEFKSDSTTRPGFITTPGSCRYRLMQLVVPTEKNSVYSAVGNSWFTSHLADAWPVADNVVALVIRPQDPGASAPDLSSNYLYDSAAIFTGTQPTTSHQLPPVVQVTMIAITESSAKLLANGAAEPAPITNALQGKFADPARFDDDLNRLEEAFIQAKPSISFQVFSSAVPIRESKWTR